MTNYAHSTSHSSSEKNCITKLLLLQKKPLLNLSRVWNRWPWREGGKYNPWLALGPSMTSQRVAFHLKIHYMKSAASDE